MVLKRVWGVLKGWVALRGVGWVVWKGAGWVVLRGVR